MSNKIKVGVITMHRVINYGSFLQAYATQHVIESLGAKCEIIDYVFPNEWHYENGLYDHRGIKTSITNVIYKLGLIKSHRKRKHVLNAIHKYLNLSESYDSPSKITTNPPVYDVYVTGSDQTWNPKHTQGDTTFLLSFAPENVKKLSLSASLAASSINDVYKASFKKYLAEYDAISIRDSNGNQVIEELVGESAVVTLDPTLLLNSSQWLEFSKDVKQIYESENYIIFYLITHSFDSRPYIYELLSELQKKTGLKVFSFTSIPKEFDIQYEDCSDISVECFIQMFSSAKYVVTSSFHGTAFAANFGIPMYSVVNDIYSKDDRQASLLSKLNISNCLVEVGTDLECIQPEYDVVAQQRLLDVMRQESILFLKKQLDTR
ncbi:polysaccharide pyruvyl transferase family protein [Vibrio diabolicus]|uniref:polysaccharide pyruvyl transferase family protein n=1 Tax=Vibrio diabolicus TaxID=50719 RepID=UPI00375352D6